MFNSILLGESCIDKNTYYTHSTFSPENDAIPIWKLEKEEVTEGMSQIVHKHLTIEHEYITDIYSNIVKNRVYVNGVHVVRQDEDNVASISAFQKDYFERRKWDNIFCSDYGKGFFDKELIKVINEKASRGCKVYCDPHPANDVFSYKNLFVLKLNHKEVKHFTGLPYDLGAQMLREKLSCEHVFVTLGKDGIAYVGPSGLSYTVPSKVSKPLRVSGAGDRVFASVIDFMTKGMDIKQGMEEAMQQVAQYVEA